MKKFLIITSIFEPNKAIEEFAKYQDWNFVVVGDKKTPKKWGFKNVKYLSPNDQEKLGYEVLNFLPWNHYSRKIIGYLYAIQNGAELIAESDDDNIPYKNWDQIPSFGGVHELIKGGDFVNMYKFFTKEHIWPRGFPLDKVLKDDNRKIKKQDVKVGVWQFLADDEPDVDAIYRLTINKQVKFDERAPLVLGKGTYCPFNSQNTFFKKEFFPLLYMPGYTTPRFTDILRGLVAQPILNTFNHHLGFGKATVYQERNEHDFLKDFESEIPCYLYAEKTITVCEQSVDKNRSVIENLVSCYQNLVEQEITGEKELGLVRAWVNDFKNLSR
jgi:hypothetical protein